MKLTLKLLMYFAEKFILVLVIKPQLQLSVDIFPSLYGGYATGDFDMIIL